MFSKALFYLKLASLAIALGSTFYAGYHFGGADGNRRASEAETAAAVAERVHANDMVTLQAKHQEIILNAVVANSEKYRAETKQLKEANAHYQKRIDELNAARISANRRVVTPDGGMWLDVEPASCTGSGGSHSGGSAQEGAGSYDLRGSQISRCRLSPASAEFLVSLASEADAVVEKFNLCRKEVQAVNTDQPLELKSEKP